MWQDFLNGLIYTLIGVATVFMALVIIMYGIKIVSAIVVSLEGKDKPVTKVDKPVVVAPQPVVVAPAPAVSDEIAPEIVAAITAAISIIMSDPGYGATPLGFRVKKIKRI